MIFPHTLVRDGFEPMRYHSIGNGRKTIAICNSHGQSLGFWGPLVRELMPHFHVLLWQPRGTCSPGGGMSAVHATQVHVDDMHAVLRAENVTRAHLMTWSTSSKIALEFQAAHPRAVASLIFVAGCFLPMPAVEAQQTRYERALATVCRMAVARPDAVHQLVLALRGTLVDSTRAFDVLGADSSEGGPVSEPLRSLLSAPVADIDSLLHYARQLLAFREHRIDDLLPTVSAPTLLVCGERDSITSPLAARAVAALIPGARVAEIAGASHYVHHEAPQHLAELVGNFVRSRRPAVAALAA